MNILIVCALLLVPAPLAPVSTLPVSIMPVQSAAAPATVIVKLGKASLEEYQHGDPMNRIQLLQGDQSARN